MILQALKLFFRLERWAASVLEAARKDLDTPRKRLAWAMATTAGTMAGSALAQSIGEALSSSASGIICPIAKFVTGPFAWAAIFGAFTLGIASLAFGGRGALRWLILAFAAGVLLIILRNYFRSNVGTYGSCVST